MVRFALPPEYSGRAGGGRYTRAVHPQDESPLARTAVGAIMRDDFMMIDGMNTVHDVLVMLRSRPVRSLVVYQRHDADEYGLLLVSDIARKVLATGRRPERLNVYEIMAKPAITVDPGMAVDACARLFERCGISRAPVVDADGRVVGVISLNTMVLRGLLPALDASASGDAEMAADAAHQDEQPRPQQRADE